MWAPQRRPHRAVQKTSRRPKTAERRAETRGHGGRRVRQSPDPLGRPTWSATATCPVAGTDDLLLQAFFPGERPFETRHPDLIVVRPPPLRRFEIFVLVEIVFVQFFSLIRVRWIAARRRRPDGTALERDAFPTRRSLPCGAHKWYAISMKSDIRPKKGKTYHAMLHRPEVSPADKAPHGNGTPNPARYASLFTRSFSGDHERSAFSAKPDIT